MNRQADIYKDLDDKILISEEFHPELIKEAHRLNRANDNAYPFLFISDDYVDSKIKTSPEIVRCMTIMRNSGVNSLFSFQGRTLLSSVGRNNANYIAILKQQTPQEWVNVIKEFLSMYFPPDYTMKEMVQFCMNATLDHQFFFIDNINGECYLTKLSAKQVAIT